MGEVWRARDTSLHRDVAIKTLPIADAGDADRLARFDREAKLLAALKHPNIASIHGLEESNGTRFFVMELVEGGTLASRLALGPVPVEQALRIALQLAEALEAAHDAGILHRDLKPANVSLTPDGSVKVLDFGLAKTIDTLSDSAATITVMTQAGTVVGTPAYMSPEQARGERVGRQTDIWAFGVVVYELLTGSSAFGGRSTAETLAQILTTQPDFAVFRHPHRLASIACCGAAWRRIPGGASNTWVMRVSRSKTRSGRERLTPLRPVRRRPRDHADASSGLPRAHSSSPVSPRSLVGTRRIAP